MAGRSRQTNVPSPIWHQRLQSLEQDLRAFRRQADEATAKLTGNVEALQMTVHQLQSSVALLEERLAVQQSGTSRSDPATPLPLTTVCSA